MNKMSEDVVIVTTEVGRKATIGRYHLTEEAINEAGERGRSYAEFCARVEAAKAEG